MRGSLGVGLIVVIAAAAGYSFGRYRAPETPQVPPLQQILRTTPGSPPSGAAAASVSDTELPQAGPTTLAGIMRLKGDFTQTAALYILASTVDRNGLERLLAEAAALQPPSEASAATGILYARYAELDPDKALDHALRRDDFQPNWLGSIFHTWARADLDAAVARAATLDQVARNAAGYAIVRARDDLPASEREKVAATFNMRLPQGAPVTPLDVRTPERAQRSWQAALATSDANNRMGRLMSVANLWVRQDPSTAMAAIESLEDARTREQLIRGALSSWAQQAPRDALEWVLARPPSQSRTQLLASTIGPLASKEPLAAMDVVRGLPPNEQRQLLPSVLSQWTASDPRSATAWVEQLEDPMLRKTALSSVASAYATRRPDEAFRWASSLPAADAPQVVTQVIMAMSWNDPVRASGFVQQLPEGTSRDQAAQTVTQAWAQRDPQAALGWLSRFPVSANSKNSLYESVFRQWAQSDVETAAAKALEIYDTPLRDRSIAAVLSSNYLDADTAERLYQRIEGQDARRRAAQTLYFSWRERDPRVAERYKSLAGIRENPTSVIRSVSDN